jgi:transposase
MNDTLQWVVGMDVSKDRLTVALAPNSLKAMGQKLPWRHLPNTLTGFQTLVGWLKPRGVDVHRCCVVMEDTGTYWESVAHFCVLLGMTVKVTTPRKVHRFAETLPLRGKTDSLDAQVLAYFGIAIPYPAWKPADPCFRQLQELMRTRQSLVEYRSGLKNQLGSLRKRHTPNRMLIQQLETLIQQLQESDQTFKKEVSALVRQHPPLKAMVEILLTIPGVGPITAWGVLGELHGIRSHHQRKSVSCYAGVIPLHHESGSSVRKKPHISRKCNHYLRHFLFEAANVAVRFNPKIAPFYQRLRNKGLSATSAKIASARKLLSIMLACGKSMIPFDPQHISVNPKKIV